MEVPSAEVPYFHIPMCTFVIFTVLLLFAHWPLWLLESITLTFDCFTTNQVLITEEKRQVMVGVPPEWLVPCIMPNVCFIRSSFISLAFVSLRCFIPLNALSINIDFCYVAETYQYFSSAQDVTMWVDNECSVYIVCLCMCRCVSVCVCCD